MSDILGKRSFYVYRHVEQDGTVVYVGMGRDSRAWQSYRCHRNPDHAAWMNARMNVGDVSFVEIIEHTCTEEYASALERSLIKELQPRFNMQHTEAYKERRRAINMVGARASMRPCVGPDGATYESLSDAARQNNVSISTIWDRVKHKKGWDYV